MNKILNAPLKRKQTSPKDEEGDHHHHDDDDGDNDRMLLPSEFIMISTVHKTLDTS